VLVVAILPLLGVGGSQLFRAESAGPMKDQKLTPRIADTARVIWVAYGGLSVACFIAYGAAGMSWPDAFMHMCSTVSLGGFSSYDASFGHWNSPLLEGVAVIFMLLAGVNLLLYFVVWRSRSLAVLWRNAEVRAFYAVLAGSTVLITGFLVANGL
jgi:trk system potassium uptake protein TrkH